MNAPHLDVRKGPEFRKLKGELRRAKGREAKRAVRDHMWNCFLERANEHSVKRLAEQLLWHRQLSQLARHGRLDASQRRTALGFEGATFREIEDWILGKRVTHEQVRLARRAAKSAKNLQQLMVVLRRIFKRQQD